eukprot:5928287-Karenia_brevis.AAC.1
MFPPSGWSPCPVRTRFLGPREPGPPSADLRCCRAKKASSLVTVSSFIGESDAGSEDAMSLS